VSEQPRRGSRQGPVLLVVAVLLATLAIAVVVLVCDRSPTPQRALKRLHTSTCVREFAFGSILVAVRRPCHRLQHPAANSQ
jgi:peptidoglycan/LPS O-acetylase OafA/YrhL